MTYRPLGGRKPDIDELIKRSLRDELTRDESDRLAEWRHESLPNEQRYRRSVRLLETMRSDAGSARPIPAAHALLSRERTSAPLFPRRRCVRALPALLTAAGIIFAAVSGAYLLRHRGEPASRADRPLADGVGYSTGASEMATVQLSDGSVVRLAPNSRHERGGA